MNGEMRKEEAKNSVVTRRITICKSSITAVSRNSMVSFKCSISFNESLEKVKLFSKFSKSSEKSNFKGI